MNRNFLPFLIAGAIPTLAQASPPDSFKNLAGGAEEMAAMRLPKAEDTGIRSKSAMIPVRFRGGKWTADLPIESSEDLRLTLLAPDGPTWQVNVVRDGISTNLREARTIIDLKRGEVGLDGVKFPAEVFTFKNAKAGTWRVEINAPATAKRDGETAGFLVLTPKSPYQLYSHLDTNDTLTGSVIGLRTRVFDTRTKTDAGSVVSATAEIGLTGGARESVALRSNGDGTFSTSFVPRISGEYAAQITVRGQTPEGEGFVRTSELVFRVVDSTASFGKAADSAAIDETRVQVNVPVSGLKDGQKVVAYAEVWGTNASGQKSPVAWIGGMAVAEGGKLPLVLDARWVGRGDAKSGFELRSVRVQDPDYFVTLAQTERISLQIPQRALASRAPLGVITEDMRMGKRPAGIVPDAVGGKLMLVHGYCAGGNPYPTAQFSSNIVFSDPNQSRSHDQFANLIRNFGASYPSFGIVAHSQGGCASLHLYTYYWSGLDSATGTRLVQSVGTPYQGTALAGNLAALGSVFGVGCGTNQNLTYSGAASWLAGIPTWARAKVHFSTTSFNDVWYAYDYCNIATDLFLGDPDDGVTEKAYGQLPGGNNRGHKTGWCHTSGMRDPAQTSDSSRNADMNSNAAR